jgi:hypothetical protein
MSHSSRNPAVLVATLALCALAACSSGSSPTAASAPAGSTGSVGGGSSATSHSPAATSAADAGGSSASGAVLHACALLSKSQASAAAGEKFTSAKEQPFSTFGTVCRYDVADGPSMDVTVMNQMAGLDLSTVKSEMAGAASKDSPLVAVSGVGDQAWADALGTSASFGSHIVQIDGLESDLFGKHHDSEAVAKAVIAAAAR